MPKFARDQAFWASVILHAALLLSLFLATVVGAFRPQEPPHVFEMVNPPKGQTPVIQSMETTPATPVEALAIPEVKPMAPLPEPPPPPQRQQPPPRERPEPTEPPSRQMVRYEDFIKNNPIKPPEASRPSPRKRFARPVIDTPKIVISRSASAEAPQPTRPSSSELNELADYQAQLRARLNAVWDKPTGLGASRIFATAIFHVSAQGRITRVRLNPSSGNAPFDRSVTAAFQRLGRAKPTPTGEAYTFKLTFRMTD